MHFAALAAVAATLATVTADTLAPPQQQQQASQFFEAPSLLEIRDILAQFVPAIVSTVVQRLALPVTPSLYAGGSKSALHAYLAAHEQLGLANHRYVYGTLEYPFTTNATVVPDHVTAANPYPPGRFHQDTFTPNVNLTLFYTQDFVPLLNATADSYFAHLSNASANLFPGRGDADAALSLDVALLQVLSNRASNGKVVAESKFLGNATVFTQLIKAQDTDSIHTLLVNRTQEGVVLAQADSAAVAFTSAWTAAGGIVPDTFEATVRNATFKVFRNLIDITTQTEVEYLLHRLD
ncbi:chorismate mutase [Gautieria morchelliformis]|nr:chorismate mutase [Gautieria morchelliformis]